MTQNKTTFVVLAAGEGKRMKSSMPKVLHELCGDTIIGHVLRVIDGGNIIIVASPKTSESFSGYKVVVQTEKLGTGHALQVALPHIDTEQIIVMYGDTPLITRETLAELEASRADICLSAFDIPKDDTHYGRIILDDKGAPLRIAEYKDLKTSEKDAVLGNAGILKIKTNLAKRYVPKLTNDNASKEYYLTQIVELCDGAQKAFIYGREQEFLGINTRAELAQASRYMNEQLIHSFMLSGVTFEKPETNMVCYDTVIGPDAVIGAHTVIGKDVVIESHVRVLPFCSLQGCIIKSGASVGPFAHIRGDVIIDSDAQIGNFIEIKQTRIGRKSKAKHFSYIGNADIGQNVNFGAGSVTCNYDGKNKHKTIIEDNAFIGANVALIAPICIKKGSLVAAGSTISKDTEEGELAIGRGEEKHIRNWRSTKDS